MSLNQPTTNDLQHQLDRERARNAGLAQGVTALNARLTELHAENAALRRALEQRDGAVPDVAPAAA
jgi:hypothetical protein